MQKLSDYLNAKILPKEDSCGSLLGTKHTTPKERGELLRFFITELNKTRKPPYKPLTFPRMAKLVAHLSTQDLYFCKSSMLDLERNGKNASAWFYWSIKPK